MECGVALWAIAILAIAIVAIVRANRSAAAARQLSEDLSGLRAYSGLLHRRLAELERRAGVKPESARTEEQPVPQPAGSQPSPMPQPSAARVTLPATGAAPQVPHTPRPITPPQPIPTPPVHQQPAPTPIRSAETAAVPETPPKIAPPVPPAPQTQPPPVVKPPSLTPPSPPSKPFDWESLIGVKAFSWLGGVTIFLGAIFLFRYSIEHGWLRPIYRATFGFLAGLGMLAVAQTRRARDYAVTAHALSATGILILYATSIACRDRYHLLDSKTVFVMMILCTAVAVALSIVRDSYWIAVMALAGGFSTPYLLRTGEDHPVGLFTYLLLLNAGLAWVAYQKKWPSLVTISLVLTTIYQWGWTMKFLTVSKLPLAAGIFLIFPIFMAGSYAASLTKKKRDDESLIDRTVAISSLLPLLFAFYLAAVPAYGHAASLLFVYLLCIDIGVAILAITRRAPEEVHLMAGIGTLLTFGLWIGASYASTSWPSVLLWLSLFVLLYAGLPLLMARLGRSFGSSGRAAVLIGSLLLFVFPIIAWREPATAAPAILFGVLFALLAVIAIAALLLENGILYYVAAFFAICTEAIWSAQHLEPKRLHAALIIYGGLALFFLGVPVAARRWKRALQPTGGGAVLLFATLGLMFFLAAGPVASASFWGLSILLAVVNLAIFFETSRGLSPLAVIGSLLSWIVIAVWWSSVRLVADLGPAMFLVALFAVVILGGNLLAKRRAQEEGCPTESFDTGLGIALVGHVFLAFIALRPDLGSHTWPLLAVLALLDLAIGIAALYTRKSNLHLAAVAASQFILMLWAATMSRHPYPTIATCAAAVVAGFAIAWMALGYRLERLRGTIGEASPWRLPSPTAILTLAAFTGLFGAWIVEIVSTVLRGAPSFALTLAIGMLLLIAVMAVAWVTNWYATVVLATAPVALLAALWYAQHSATQFWWQNATLDALFYAALLAYPLIVGHRARARREPYLAAILFSVPCFFLARQSFVDAGWNNRIGLLPVIQAALLMVLVIRLLQIEPAGRRDIGRLAMVCGAVLAFITAAIPLQLEKQWITVAWGLEVAALCWLFGRIPHRGLLAWAAALAAVVFARLIFNPAVFSYHPRAGVAIWNWYLYAYGICALSFFLGAWLLGESKPDSWKTLPQLLNAAGTILLFVVLNIEIADFFSGGPTITFNFFSENLAQGLTYTLSWAIFAICMLVSGIVFHSRASRIGALGLLVVTILKCFLYDLLRLGGLYIVGSLVGLGICLFAVAILLQRFVIAPMNQPKEELG
jgi:hypothetical protein